MAVRTTSFVLGTLLLSFLVISGLTGCGGVKLDQTALSDARSAAGGTPDTGDPEPTDPGDEPAPAGMRSVSLHSYNSWTFGYYDESASTLQERLEVTAQRDYVVITEHSEWINDVGGWDKFTPRSLKALHPGIKVYRYYASKNRSVNDSDHGGTGDTRRIISPLTWEQIDSNDWWLRDGDGNIVKEPGDKIWFLDVGKPGFKEAYLEAALRRNAGKGFDGFVLDGLWPDISNQWFAHNGWFTDHPMPPAYPTGQDWYTKAWQPFFEYVTSGLKAAGYEVIANCAGEYGTANPMFQWQRSKVDGVIYEQGSVDWDGSWLAGHIIERRINSIANDPLRLVWFADGGLSQVPANTAEQKRKAQVSLAMYYVAVPRDQSRHSYHYAPGNSRQQFHWDALWDLYIGEPAQERVQVSGRYQWSRKFSKGLVLLNYEDSESFTYQLDRQYKDYTGKKYAGTVTLSPHSALILANSN